MLTQEQADNIFDRIKKLSSADEVEVLFSGGKFALTRFANNTIHQNVAEENAVVSLRTVFGGRTARATTNKFDDESLRQVVKSSESLARAPRLSCPRATSNPRPRSLLSFALRVSGRSWPLPTGTSSPPPVFSRAV